MRKFFIGWTILGVLVIALLALGLYSNFTSNQTQITNFEECSKQSNSVIQESYPAVCITQQGDRFVQSLDKPLESPSPKESPTAENGCMITGCSGQICAEEEIVTTCEYREEYTCFEMAICERQGDGECGWTETEEFNACMNEASVSGINL